MEEYMLEKKVFIDQIEIVPQANVVQVRVRTAILEDGIEVSHSLHRHAFTDADIVKTIMDKVEENIQ